MKSLLIIGAGGHGRCCLDIARENNIYDQISFLDDNAVGQTINDTEVLGNTKSLSEYKEKNSDVFVAIGNNTLRRELIHQAEILGYRVISLISPRSIVSDYAILGKGSVVFPGTVVEANAKIGEGCIVAANATINHDAVIQDYVLINSNTVIRPNTTIGESTKIGCQCMITFGKHVDAKSEIPDGKVI